MEQVALRKPKFLGICRGSHTDTIDWDVRMWRQRVHGRTSLYSFIWLPCLTSTKARGIEVTPMGLPLVPLPLAFSLRRSPVSMWKAGTSPLHEGVGGRGESLYPQETGSNGFAVKQLKASL
eukprot:4961035-Amphidinium_carterae.1